MRVRSVAMMGLVASLTGFVLAQDKTGADEPAGAAAPQDGAVKESKSPVRSGFERSAYLGISTVPVDPALADQIGLPNGVGLVVEFIDEESPAAKALQTHDILKKLNDQILVSQEQLAVLVRLQKPGDSVKLAVFRKGKEIEVTALLGEKEMPKLGSRSGSAPKIFFGPPEIPNLKMWLEKSGFGEMPPIPGEEFFTNGAPMPGHSRSGVKDSTHLTPMPGVSSQRVVISGESQMNMIRENGRTYILRGDGKQKNLTVVGEDGKTVFDGAVNTDEEKQKLPKDIAEKLQRLDRSARDVKPRRLDTDGKVL